MAGPRSFSKASRVAAVTLHITHSTLHRARLRRDERGIALLIVVSMLTMVGIMGVAFAFSMHLETQATRQFVSTTQARYVAEGGISYARALLDEDRLGSRVDDTTEPWATDSAGSDVDLDGDGTLDARWWLVRDAAAQTVGRYALAITDESGKANLNAAQAEPDPLGLGAINLTTLLEEASFSNARAAAEAIERYRYGDDGRPGVAGVDDDGDGAIDEPDEHQPLALRGDDRRLEALEELVAVTGLGADEVQRLSRLATVYSWDANVSVSGKARANVNTATAAELLLVLLEAGVDDPWQAAANMADYADADFDISRVTKASQQVLVSNQGTLGGWTWSETPSGHYASEAPGGAALVWSASVPSGTYRLLARGIPGIKIGDVTVEGELKSSVDAGESLGLFELSGSVDIRVENHEPEDTPCAFRGIELVSEATSGGVAVRGVEPIRFNELMVEPRVDFDVSSATFDAQGSDWACPIGSSACTNSGVGQARWVWTSPLLKLGRYYVRVFGSAPGQTVGEVRIDSDSQLLVNGQSHPSPIAVGSDGKISLTIGKTAAEETYYLKSIALSLQPDGEYVELINLSGRDVDVSGWTIEGELTSGRQATLPSGSVIASHGLLVAAVDLDDSQMTLGGNGIDARSAWAIPAGAKAVQLDFLGGVPSPDDDWLKASPPGGSLSRLRLRSGAVTVDEIEYPVPASPKFQSLEKGDPSVIVDEDLDGVDEGWYPSLKLYTAGLPNDNDGLKELIGLETLIHDPAEEITILNRPLEGVGELAGLPSGQTWKPFSSTDLAKIVDRLTVEGYRLESEGHWSGSVGEEGWEEKVGGYYLHTDPSKADVSGRWQWADLPDGAYRLSLYGCQGCLGEQMSVRVEQKDGQFTDWSPALSTDAQGRIVIGQVTVGMGQTSPNTLALEVLCESPSGVCHFDHVRLDPQLVRLGAVNVNTAPREVLLALPGMTEAQADRLIAGRPYGDQEQKGRGVGDLLISDVFGADEEDKLAAFRRLAHLLTTHSDVFQIVSIGQAMDDDRANATQRILTVVQR